MIFLIGDRVIWSSKANGSKTNKQGIVKAIVPPQTSVNRVLGHIKREERIAGTPTSYLGPRYDISPMDSPGDARNHESYIVAVPVYSRAGTLIRTKLYWPRVLYLQRVTS
jgi:hypothetical protein